MFFYVLPAGMVIAYHADGKALLWRWERRQERLSAENLASSRGRTTLRIKIIISRSTYFIMPPPFVNRSILQNEEKEENAFYPSPINSIPTRFQERDGTTS